MIERIKRFVTELLKWPDPAPSGDLAKHRLYSEMYEDLRQ